jgi:hypothetical protein
MADNDPDYHGPESIYQANLDEYRARNNLSSHSTRLAHIQPDNCKFDERDKDLIPLIKKHGLKAKQHINLLDHLAACTLLCGNLMDQRG